MRLNVFFNILSSSHLLMEEIPSFVIISSVDGRNPKQTT